MVEQREAVCCRLEFNVIVGAECKSRLRKRKEHDDQKKPFSQAVADINVWFHGKLNSNYLENLTDGDTSFDGCAAGECVAMNSGILQHPTPEIHQLTYSS